MAIPANKEELQIAIRTSYEKLKKELATIPVELTDIPDLDGHAKGTSMSIHNLLSYLVGWGELVLHWNNKRDNHEPVDFPETGYKWNELGKLAQKFYRDYQNNSFELLCQKSDAVVDNLVEQKSDNELYEVSWYEKWTLGRMIQFNTSSPYANARSRIRRWKKSRNIG